MFDAIIDWWKWLTETFRALFLPPVKEESKVTWIGETGFSRR